jgi:hypothetical protein
VSLVHGVDDGEDSGETTAVVADTWAFEEIALAGYMHVGFRREDSIEVRGENEVRVRGYTGAVAEDVAGFVDADVGEASGSEEARKLGGALVFVERWRGNFAETDLFGNEMGFGGFDDLHCGLNVGLREYLRRGLLGSGD